MDYDLGSGRTIVSIEDEWKVLDVGSGHWPFPKATACVDLYLKDPTNQRTQPLLKTRNLVCADACDELPFKDGAFDYSIAVHIAEHVLSPDKFCREIMRVSRAGYLETPSKLNQILIGAKDAKNPAHLWYVYLVGKVLTFEKIREYAPFGRFFHDLYFSPSSRPQFLEAVHKSRDLFWTRLEWREKFEFRVVEDSDSVCYL